MLNKNSANSTGMLVILVWSLYPFLILGAGDTPSFLLVSLSLIIAGGCLLRASLRKGLTVRSIAQQSTQSYILVIAGFTGYLCCLTGAFKLIPAYEVNTLNYLWPILLAFISTVIARKAPNSIQIAVFLTGFLGVVFIFWSGNNSFTLSQLSVGHVLALSAAIVWAVYSALTKYVPFEKDAMSIYMLLSGVLCMVMHISFEDFYMPSITETIFIFLFGITRISFAFWDYAMKKGNTLLLSALANCIPLFSSGALILTGYKAMQEQYLLSSALIILSCLLLGYDSFLRTKKHSEKKI